MDVRPAADGVRISVRVRPRSRPRIEERDGALVVSVAAPPVDGRATEEARRALAAALGLTPSAVELRLGVRTTTKVFEARGLGVEEAMARLRAACG